MPRMPMTSATQMAGTLAVWLLVFGACSGEGRRPPSDASPLPDRPDVMSGAIDGPGWDGAAEIKGRLCSPTVDSCPSKVCLLQRCVPRYLRTQVFASGNVASFDWFQVGKDGTFYVGGALAAGSSIEVGVGRAGAAAPDRAGVHPSCGGRRAADVDPERGPPLLERRRGYARRGGGVRRVRTAAGQHQQDPRSAGTCGRSAPPGRPNGCGCSSRARR